MKPVEGERGVTRWECEHGHRHVFALEAGLCTVELASVPKAERAEREALARRELAVIARGEEVPRDFADDFVSGVLRAAACESLEFLRHTANVLEAHQEWPEIAAAIEEARKALAKAQRGEEWR